MEVKSGMFEGIKNEDDPGINYSDKARVPERHTTRHRSY